MHRSNDGVMGTGSAAGHSTSEFSNLSTQAHGYGVAPSDGVRVLNALDVLKRMDYQAGDRVLVENFLRILGERGMWVIDNPLAAGVAACQPAQERAEFEAAMEGEELDFTLYTLPGCENSYSNTRTQLAYFAWRQGRATSGVSVVKETVDELVHRGQLPKQSRSK